MRRTKPYDNALTPAEVEVREDRVGLQHLAHDAERRHVSEAIPREVEAGDVPVCEQALGDGIGPVFHRLGEG